MAYRFLKLKYLNLEYPWRLYCTSLEQLIEHTKLYMNPKIGEGVRDYLSSKDGMKHLTTEWGGALSATMQLRGTSLMESGTYLEKRVIEGKIAALQRDGHLILSDNGSYFTMTSEITILDEITIDSMVYPHKFSEKDIRVVVWPGGTHFYPKIGNLDVVWNGRQKWDTEREARNAAIQFINSKK